jgi:hypothetical protein
MPDFTCCDRPLRLLPSVLLLLCLFSPLPALADYYRYADGQGTVCFTDDYKSIPRQFRAKAQRIKEPPAHPGQLPPPPPARQPATAAVQPEATAAEQPPPPQPARAELLLQTLREFWARAWFRVVAFVALAGAVLLLLARVARHLAAPQLVRVIYLAFFLGCFVFAYKLYADYMVQSYFIVKARALEMMQQANRREPALSTEQP